MGSIPCPFFLKVFIAAHFCTDVAFLSLRQFEIFTLQPFAYVGVVLAGVPQSCLPPLLVTSMPQLFCDVEVETFSF